MQSAPVTAMRVTVLVLALCGSQFVSADVPTIGSTNVATADPVLAPPYTTPCTVTLYENQEFADFNAKPFQYAPPSACPGPWQKVVLSADYSVTIGRQFDRTAEIWLGGAIVYFGTTQEPSSSVAPSWHIDRDLTEQIVDVAIVARRFRQDHDLAGARGGRAHAVGLLAVAIGTADHPQQQALALSRIGRKVLGAEEHALAGAAAHVDGGNAKLVHRTINAAGVLEKAR